MTSLLRVVFFGTPNFAVPSLKALLDAGIAVPLVVSQPDRPVGRHAGPHPSAVAAVAEARGIPIEKPATVRDNPALFEALAAARPDAIAVVAYGRILPTEILRLPPMGCLNVHASPIQAAILAGDPETGVATMRMEEGLDTGPVYLERRVRIGDRETAGELSSRLAEMGGEILVETLHGLAAGTLSARPQAGEPSLCRPIRREDGAVDWTRSAGELSRRLRAYTPWPGLYSFLGSERVKILDADADAGSDSGEPGSFRLEGGRLVASAGEGTALRIERLQRAGRKPVTGAEFARSVQLPGRFESPL